MEYFIQKKEEEIIFRKKTHIFNSDPVAPVAQVKPLEA